MDTNFIGLIFSCFTGGSVPGSSRFEVTAFQTAASGKRHEIPVKIVQTDGHRLATLEALAVLPQIFFEEERKLFESAQQSGNGCTLSHVHNNAVFTAAVTRLLDRVCAPLINTLTARLSRNALLEAELRAQKDKLLEARTKAKTNPFL